MIKSSSKTMNFLIALTVKRRDSGRCNFGGLDHTDTLNLKQFQNPSLIAPPPPPPPAPAVVELQAAPVHRVFENAGKLIAPNRCRKILRTSKRRRCPPEFECGGVAGGVPGGVAGGSMAGVIGGVIGGVSTTVVAPLAPKRAGPKALVRVAGRVPGRA